MLDLIITSYKCTIIVSSYLQEYIQYPADYTYNTGETCFKLFLFIISAARTTLSGAPVIIVHQDISSIQIVNNVLVISREQLRTFAIKYVQFIEIT